MKLRKMKEPVNHVVLVTFKILRTNPNANPATVKHREQTATFVMTMENVAVRPMLLATGVTNVLLVTIAFHLAQVD